MTGPRGHIARCSTCPTRTGRAASTSRTRSPAARPPRSPPTCGWATTGRSATPRTGTGFDSQQLYDFATQNNNPTTADSLGRTFNNGGNGLAEAANGLLDAVTQLDGAWSGVAADSARAALAPLAQAAGQAGQTAQMMGVQMSRQSVAASEVRKLPPAQKFDQKQSLTAMLAGGPAAMQADMKAQKDAADAVKREQIALPERLHPGHERRRRADAQLRAAEGADPPGRRRRRQDHRRAGAVLGPARRLRPGHLDGRTVRRLHRRQPRRGRGRPATARTAPTATDFTLPGSLPGTSTAGFTSTGPTAPVSAPTAPVGGAHLSGPSAGCRRVRRRVRQLRRRVQRRRHRWHRRRGRRGRRSDGRGRAVRRRRRARSGPGRPGWPVAARGAGGQGGAGGRRKGEDDDEHERPSFLVEGDPEGTFGSDQMTAPSVIGSDEDD